MDAPTLMMLGCAVFGASCLQSATGIGYGVIAGPIFLVALDGTDAFQISTIHNLCIAVTLLPFLWKHLNAGILRALVLGSSMGILAGFHLQATVDVAILKIAATLMVGFVITALIRDMRRSGIVGGKGATSPIETGGIGVLAGVMGGMLAMPGPPAATWMSIKGIPKAEVRATILAFFVFAYGANILLYTSVTSFSARALSLSLWMLAPLMLGIVAGNRLSGLLSERTFRWALLVVLIATMLFLIADWSHSH